MINVMEEDTKDILMGTSTKGNFNMGKLMAKVGISGSNQGRSMMESGPRASDMAMESGRESSRTQMVQSLKLETPILVSGDLAKLKDMVSTHGKTATNMKVNGKCA